MNGKYLLIGAIALVGASFIGLGDFYCGDGCILLWLYLANVDKEK